MCGHLVRTATWQASEPGARLKPGVAEDGKAQLALVAHRPAS